MSVRRWVLTNAAGTVTYTFPRNPMSMTSPYPLKPVTSMATTAGKILLTEGSPVAQSWTFTGPLLDKQNLTDLLSWTYNFRQRVNINDHFGRNITCYLTNLDVVPKRRTGYYFSHDYTITALVLAISAATVANGGPGA